jgi:uncharacterized protein (DUF1778 family)
MATLTRIDIRIEELKKKVIVKAAELNGQNLTQYIMSIVWPDAEQRVNQDTRIKLSAHDWKQFCERLDMPTQDLPELKKLLGRPSRFKA